MGLFYRIFFMSALKFQDSEKAHRRSLRMLRITSRNPISRSILKLLYRPKSDMNIDTMGMKFTNPFGVAAGMDKSAEALEGWSSLGVGFTEIGGITMLQQEGNPKPRMFRLNSKEILINRMGFNNIGSEKMAHYLSQTKSRRSKHVQPLWVNVGKSKLTPLEDAKIDYGTTIERLWPYVDAFVINVSSPNTPELRKLQNEAYLDELLSHCNRLNEDAATRTGRRRKPMLVKVAPDIEEHDFDVILSTVTKSQFDGIVVCNTTIQRPSPMNDKEERILNQAGGLSGRFLHEQSLRMISHAYSTTKGQLTIVGVGGIFDAKDAIQCIRAGATLVQAYSGFVFHGPTIINNIVKGIKSEMKKENVTHYHDLVGRDHGF